MKKNKMWVAILIFTLSMRMFASDGYGYFDVYDPFETFNRRVYYLNYQLDKYVFLPTVKFYKDVTPIVVRSGVRNFFQNAKNISTTGNSIFQLKIKKAMRSLGRFTMNVAFGGFGTVDAATKFGMPIPYEDFGLTLAHYGVGKGPFLMLPVLGPSNLRDAFGMGVDTVFTFNTYDQAGLGRLNNPGMTVLKGIDKRTNIPFRYYGTGSPFEYEYIRFLYQKYRKLQSDIGTEVF